MMIRLGTRGSRLARVQSTDVARKLERLGHDVEMVLIKTLGDRVQGVPFEKVGPAGVFVVELEKALLERRIDLAVHSYKDLPSTGPDGLLVSAVPERLDPCDALLVRSGRVESSEKLPVRQEGVVGTASKRREVWVRELRPDLSTEMLRGNLPTRVRRLANGDFDAILLAWAGLERLARAAQEHGEEPLPLDGIEIHRLDKELFVPAPSQGAIAIQIRADDKKLRAVTDQLDDPITHRQVRAERELLQRVEGGCTLPFGAWCRSESDGSLRMIAMLEVERQIVRAAGTAGDPVELAASLHRQLLGENR